MSHEPNSTHSFRRLLAPAAWAYSAAMRVRNRRYDRQVAEIGRAACPVISIGNITVGGTGKTPIVIETVSRLLEFGRRPAILTRGYGAAAGTTADEVLEFADALPDVPVVVNPDRIAGAQRALDQHDADCLVLDDGFQHRRLHRDLDVVLIDALDPFDNGWVLPAGRLREPLVGLGRAGLFIIARSNQVDPSALRAIEAVLARYAPDVPLAFAELVPQAIVLDDGVEEPPEKLGYHAVLPVSGIGNPATFVRAVAEVAGQVCTPLAFRDHHRYKPGDVRRIKSAARRSGADLVVTTRKDWVKLAPLWTAGRFGADALPLARLDVRLDLCRGADVFDELLESALESSIG